MHYIVCPIRPAGDPNPNGSINVSDKVTRDVLKVYDTDLGHAKRRAEQLAAKYPEIQFGVFVITNIFECLPPPPPKVLQKKLNDNGELVLA